MRILQLCKKNPYPTFDGETIAILSITKELHRAGHEVTLLAMNTPKHQFDISLLPDEVKSLARFETVFVNTQLHPIKAIIYLIRNQSYNIARFTSSGYQKKVIKLLQTQHYDAVLMEGIYLAPYLAAIRKHAPQTPVFMRTHNIEHIIWQRLAKEEKNPIKGLYLKILAQQFKAYEEQMLPQFDGIVPISPIDAEELKRMGYQQKMFVLPAGVDTGSFHFSLPDTQTKPTLYFIGSLDWLPNRQGLVWLMNEVLPIVRNTMPDVQLFIAGRNAPADFLKLQSTGVTIVGEVPNAINFMKEHTVMVVPLFSGSGMRVKIIEAMALGKPIIATSIAAEGIAYTDGKNLLIADTPKVFAQNIITLLKNTDYCKQISLNARNFAIQNHDNRILVKKLIDFFNEK